jgi:hypothetical protein
VKAATAVGLPEEVLKIIREAPRYAEGRGVRISVRNRRQNAAVKTVAEAKMGT